jgi:hypothetical protein
LHPQWADEQSYLIQMQMLARGRLWMPEHPAGDFFESFYLLVKGHYASIYFPGTALMFVPAIWLHLPSWVLPVLASGLVVALVYRILTHLLDGVWGLLAALLVLSSVEFGFLSTMVMSEVPYMLAGLLSVSAYLRWRESRRLLWALVTGAFLGWATITRLADGLLFALPIGLAMLLDLRGRPFVHSAKAFAMGIAGASPFLLLQLVFNATLTGSLFVPPHHFYTNRFAPQTNYGFQQYDPKVVPATTLPQKLSLYQEMVKDIPGHQWSTVGRTWLTDRGPTGSAPRMVAVLRAGISQPLLLVFLPLGLVGLRRRRRWVLAAGLPLFVLVYAGYFILLPIYPVVVVPATIVMVLAGAKIAVEAWRRRVPAAATFVGLAIALSTLGRFSLWNRELTGVDSGFQAVTFARDVLPGIVKKPAVVFFRWSPKSNIHDEPVYNTCAAWPDDCAVVLAQDLGPRNHELIEYYARHQPGRHFYLVDRGSGRVFAVSAKHNDNP